MSVIAVDNLQNYIYVEAERKEHVIEACRGLQHIYSSAKITVVPTKEMPDVLSVREKSKKTGEGTSSSSTPSATRTRGRFKMGDRILVVNGELENMKGCVEKVQENMVHVKPDKDQPGFQVITKIVEDKDVLKFFQIGDHVKVVAGVHEGLTGMVVKVDGDGLIIFSDTTMKHISVLANYSEKI